MKMARQTEKICEVSSDVAGLTSYPWVVTMDMHNGCYPCTSHVNPTITHWVEKGAVWAVEMAEFEEPDNGTKNQYQFLLPECDIIVKLSDPSFDYPLTPMQKGLELCRVAHERLDSYANSLHRAGCDHVVLFIITRPVLVGRGKNASALIQFCACGWKG